MIGAERYGKQVVVERGREAEVKRSGRKLRKRGGETETETETGTGRERGKEGGRVRAERREGGGEQCQGERVPRGQVDVACVVGEGRIRGERGG